MDPFLTAAAGLSGLVAYHHFAFPALTAGIGALAPVAPKALEMACQGELTIVMPAHNEARHIAAKIDAIAASDYPLEQITVLIGCDGSTDDTANTAIAALDRHPRLNWQVVSFPNNRGKVAVLNELMSLVTTPVTVLSDVSAIPSPQALSGIMNWFRDPKLGAVGAGYALAEHPSAGQSLFYKYLVAVKRGENHLAGLVGAHGALYAIRTDLYRDLPKCTINDDFIIPMQIACEGWKTVYDPSITVAEVDIVSDKADFQRRRRIGAGNLQQMLWLLPAVLRSAKPGLILTFLSGKVLRVFMGPILLLILILAALAASDSLIGSLALGLTLVGLSASRIARYVLNGHLQSMIGAFNYLTNKQKTAWRRVTATADT